MHINMEFFYALLRRMVRAIKRPIYVIPKIYRRLTYQPDLPLAAVEHVTEKILDIVQQPVEASYSGLSSFETSLLESSNYALVMNQPIEPNALGIVTKTSRANHLNFYTLLFLLELIFGVIFVWFVICVVNFASTLAQIYRCLKKRFIQIIEKYVYVQFYDDDEEPVVVVEPQAEAEEELWQDVQTSVEENKEEEVMDEQEETYGTDPSTSNTDDNDSTLDDNDSTLTVSPEEETTVTNKRSHSPELGPWNAESDEDEAYAVFCRELERLTFSTPTHAYETNSSKRRRIDEQQEQHDDWSIDLDDFFENN